MLASESSANPAEALSHSCGLSCGHGEGLADICHTSHDFELYIFLSGWLSSSVKTLEIQSYCGISLQAQIMPHSRLLVPTICVF